ncbi:MAG TPA: DNA replication/repair protein RecF [Firmicutes bacterium]|nr:DNA replication/repair protein RecF [Bacillota bacterium]
MRLERMMIKDFRNYKILNLQLSPQINVFYGQNAQGKTNFLEAVSYLVWGRSFRTHRDEELIREGEGGFFLKGEFYEEETASALTAEIGYNCRQFLARINGKKYHKKRDLFGLVKAVTFSPDDLWLIKGGPSYRREFLDLYLSQAYPAYRNALREYYRILQQRNKLLKEFREGRGNNQLLESWTESFLESGSRLVLYRLRGLEEIRAALKEYHCWISGTREEINCSYWGCGAGQQLEQRAIAEEIGRCLRRRRGEEIRRGITLAGPHRDDLLLTINRAHGCADANDPEPTGVNVRIYGSQGQQRTAALALKMAMVDLIAREDKTPPLLLLDDVFSEFDDSRKKELLKLLTTKTQTFITTTEPETVKDLPGEIWFFHVKEGMIIDRK